MAIGLWAPTRHPLSTGGSGGGIIEAQQQEIDHMKTILRQLEK